MQNIKVIFHIDEMSKWKLLLANVGNLMEIEGSDEFQVEILANSEAVKYFDITKNIIEDFTIIKNLISMGVIVAVCNNSLMANQLRKQDIASFVEIVPAGVLELALKQTIGYAYIKP